MYQTERGLGLRLMSNVCKLFWIHEFGDYIIRLEDGPFREI